MKWPKLNFLSGWNKDKTIPPVEERRLPINDLSQKTKEELLNAYWLEKLVISSIASQNLGKVDKLYYKKFNAIENELIARLPDGFQRAVFQIFARHKFDIVDLMKDDNWKEDMRDTCKEICHFLHWGSPYPFEASYFVLPFSGHEFLVWLISKAQVGSKDRQKDIFSAAKTISEEKKIFGYEFSENDIQSVFGRLIVIFAGEFAGKTAVLIDIWLEVDGGKSFIENILADMP